MTKKFNYEAITKEGEVLFTINSDSIEYIKKRRNKEMFDASGNVYQKYFLCREEINGEDADMYF